MAVAALLAACGGGSSSGASSGASHPSGTYTLQVVSAKFPTSQRLAQTSQLLIDVRNPGRTTIPALTVTTSIAGGEGRASSLPFAVRSPQPGLAIPNRPVWVLAEHFPKLAGSAESAGAPTANPKTFNFGPLKPGATKVAVWKVTAVKAGRYTLLYRIAPDLSGAARARTPSGVAPGGSFQVAISSTPPNTVVTDNGEVVEISGRRRCPRPDHQAPCRRE
ncbi:MAG TPA: hypothetical protein VND98_07915 [Solirubrobacterales bacterium]|nr:hypothetical protein [Solirubrobacterales bacterium]